MKEVIHEMYSKEQIDQMVTEIATRINNCILYSSPSPRDS